MPKSTILILSLLSLLSFPMVISASPDSQSFASWMQKHIVGRDLQQPGPELARRAPPNSSHTAISTSTNLTSSTKAPSPASTSHQSPTSTSTSTSTPAPTPTTRPPSTPSPHTPPTSSPVASSTTPSVVFTTSTSTHLPDPLSSTSTVQPSTPASSTPTTSTPSAVTTFGLSSPLTFPSTVEQIPQTSTSAISAADASTSPSPKGFFAKKGAVAGTFTVVGLVIAALLVTLLIYVFKRRRTNDDDDDALFEKIPGPASYDGSTGNRGLGSLSPIYPPVTNAYADDGYAHTTNVHDGDYNYEPEQYGMQYPPRTTYTTQQHQEAYAASRMPRSTSPPSHPYASPFNSPTSNEAPVHVNPRASSIAYGIPHDSQDSFYGARD